MRENERAVLAAGGRGVRAGQDAAAAAAATVLSVCTVGSRLCAPTAQHFVDSWWMGGSLSTPQ
jgi:hypothetical protein